MPNFRDLPVQDLEGITRNFEQLTAFRFKGTVLEGTLDEPTLKKEAIKSSNLVKVEYVAIGTVRKPKELLRVSATRAGTVLWINGAGETTAVKVNGVNVLPTTLATNVCFPFKVPIAQEWEYEGVGEGHSTYILE